MLTGSVKLNHLVDHPRANSNLHKSYCIHFAMIKGIRISIPLVKKVEGQVIFPLVKCIGFSNSLEKKLEAPYS